MVVFWKTVSDPDFLTPSDQLYYRALVWQLEYDCEFLQAYPLTHTHAYRNCETDSIRRRIANNFTIHTYILCLP